MKLLRAIFGRKTPLAQNVTPKAPPQEFVNHNYICLVADPINTVNDLRKGEWNKGRVNDGLLRGVLRYAKQHEVDQAYKEGRL